jgi:hypothetical protein
MSISEIKFFSTDSVHTVSNTLINAISIDNAGNWTLANNSDWTSGLNSNTKYIIQVKLSSTLLGNTVNGSGDTSEITIDTTIADAPVGSHTVAISNDAGVLDNDRITNDSAVKVSLTLGNNLVYTVLPNKVHDNLTCMVYFVLLVSPEVQLLLFANVQLPVLSMLIALVWC